MPAGSRGIVTGYLNSGRRRLCQQDSIGVGMRSLHPNRALMLDRSLLPRTKRCALRSSSELCNDGSDGALRQIWRWRLGGWVMGNGQGTKGRTRLDWFIPGGYLLVIAAKEEGLLLEFATALVYTYGKPRSCDRSLRYEGLDGRM